MESKEPFVVYWAPLANLDKEHQSVLLELPLIAVMKDLILRRNKKIKPWTNPADMFSNGYHICEALKEMAKNTFYIKAPFAVDVTFSQDGNNLSGERAGWFTARHGSLTDSFAADFDYSYLFFSEENLNVSVTPPYLHQTSQPEYGFVCSAGFDISSWFRPWILAYQLWPNKNRIHFKENEPLGYIKFDTDREIVFKEFKLNARILGIVDACAGHKYIINFEPLERLYRRFNNTSMKKRLTQEIKSNLLD